MKSSDGRRDATRRRPDHPWEVTDRAWRGVERVIERLDPPLTTGRPRINPRRALNGMLYRERTGCQWREIPQAYGDDATIHRTYRRWLGLGVLDKIREVLAEAEKLRETEESAISMHRCRIVRRSGNRRKGGFR